MSYSPVTISMSGRFDAITAVHAACRLHRSSPARAKARPTRVCVELNIGRNTLQYAFKQPGYPHEFKVRILSEAIGDGASHEQDNRRSCQSGTRSTLSPHARCKGAPYRTHLFDSRKFLPTQWPGVSRRRP